MKNYTLNVFLCGTGTVGGTLLQQIASQQPSLLTDRNLTINVVGVADIFNIITDAEGIDLTGFDIAAFRQQFAQAPKSSIQVIHDAALSLGLPDMVFVDCTASKDVADLYMDMLSAGISVVCANKIAASGDYDHYQALKATARQNDCKYMFETNVGAGLPLISTINALRATGDRITKIEAVLSGTLNYIFNTIFYCYIPNFFIEVQIYTIVITSFFIDVEIFFGNSHTINFKCKIYFSVKRFCSILYS